MKNLPPFFNSLGDLVFTSKPIAESGQAFTQDPLLSEMHRRRERETCPKYCAVDKCTAVEVDQGAVMCSLLQLCNTFNHTTTVQCGDRKQCNREYNFLMALDGPACLIPWCSEE